MASLFSKKPSAPAPPLTPPTVADPAVQQAAADQAAALRNRRGRASTILTNPSGQTTGGGNTLLG